MKDWPWYGYIVIAIIIFGLFYFFYYKPKNQELVELREKRIQTENEVVELKRQKEELDQIEVELANMRVKLKELETIIPKEEEIADILNRIEQLANDSRLNIDKFIPRPLVQQEFYAEKPIDIEITGNYHNLAIFFNRLSNFARLFTIPNFSIKSMRNQTDTNTITAATTAKTYIFVEPPPAEQAPSKKPTRKRP